MTYPLPSREPHLFPWLFFYSFSFFSGFPSSIINAQALGSYPCTYLVVYSFIRDVRRMPLHASILRTFHLPPPPSPPRPLYRTLNKHTLLKPYLCLLLRVHVLPYFPPLHPFPRYPFKFMLRLLGSSVGIADDQHSRLAKNPLSFR